MNDAFAAAAGRLTRLRGLIAERIVILDGATGTITWDDRGQRIDPPVDFVTFEDGAFKSVE